MDHLCIEKAGKQSVRLVCTLKIRRSEETWLIARYSIYGCIPSSLLCLQFWLSHIPWHWNSFTGPPIADTSRDTSSVFLLVFKIVKIWRGGNNSGNCFLFMSWKNIYYITWTLGSKSLFTFLINVSIKTDSSLVFQLCSIANYSGMRVLRKKK